MGGRIQKREGSLGAEYCPLAVGGQFAVAALEGKHGLSERRILLNQKPAVINRRHNKAEVTHCYPGRWFDSPMGA